MDNKLKQGILDYYEFSDKSLKQKADELNAYNIGRDGLKEKITIENTDGMKFEISNSVIIGKILTLCANELNDLVENSEKEVLNFTV